MEQRNDELEINLVELFYVIKSKILVILLTAVVFAAGSGLYTHYLITPMYSSTSCIYVLSNDSGVSYYDFMIGSSITVDYIEMIKSDTVMERTIENLGIEDSYSVESLKSSISISNPTDTRILKISVTNADPLLAKEIVDEVVEVAIDRISEVMNVEKPNIYEKGKVAVAPISPSMKKNVVMAGMLGVLLSMALFIIIYLMDDRIHSAEDVEKYLGINVLASIPIVEEQREQIKIDRRKRLGKK